MNDQNPDTVCVVYCTAPEGSGKAIAEELLKKRLVACVNIFPVRSVYRWDGEIQNDSEELLMIKSTISSVRVLTDLIISIHPYDVPEVIVLPVIDGYSGYLSWVLNEVTSMRKE